MDIIEFRAAAMALYKATFDKRSDLRVSYENGAKVDFDTSTTPVIHMDIIYSSASQRDISVNPWVTDRGNLLFSIFVKEGSNNLVATKLLKEVKDNFQLTYLGTARLYEASILGTEPLQKGWVAYRIRVPFEVDSLLR